MSLMLLAWLAAAAPVSIESVALRPVGGGPGIVVVAHQALPPVVVSRDGERLRVRIPGARLSPRFAGPRLFALRASASRVGGATTRSFDLQVRQGAGGVLLELRVPTDVSFVVHQEGAFLSFSFRDPDRGPSAGTSLLVAAHAPAADRPEAAAGRAILGRRRPPSAPKPWPPLRPWRRRLPPPRRRRSPLCVPPTRSR